MKILMLCFMIYSCRVGRENNEINKNFRIRPRVPDFWGSESQKSKILPHI